MCTQMGFKQIMCVFLPLSFVSYVWFLSRKVLNKRAHSYNGNTTVYSCPVCAKTFSTLAGLKRHEQSGLHQFQKKPSKNNTLLNYFALKKEVKKSKSQKRKREEPDIRWGMVPKRKQRKKEAEEANQHSKERSSRAQEEQLKKKKSGVHLPKVAAGDEHPLMQNEVSDMEEDRSLSGDDADSNEDDVAVDDDNFPGLVNSEDEEVIGGNEVGSSAKPDASQNDGSDENKIEGKQQKDVDEPESPGDTYRRVMNVKVQECLNLIDNRDGSYKFD